MAGGSDGSDWVCFTRGVPSLGFGLLRWFLVFEMCFGVHLSWNSQQRRGLSCTLYLRAFADGEARADSSEDLAAGECADSIPALALESDGSVDGG